MKTSYSVVFFVLLLLITAGVVLFLSKKDADKPKTLLQTLNCYSEKIDKSVLDLDSHTSLIGAMISFDKLPLDDELKNKLNSWGIELNNGSAIFEYVLAEIPTSNLCSLVEEEQVKSVFIPTPNR